MEQQPQFDAFDLSVNLNDNNKKAVEIKFRWEYASTTPFIKNEGILFEEKKMMKFLNLKQQQHINHIIIAI